MWYLERMAVLAISRWAKKPKHWEKPSWWITAEDKKKRIEALLLKDDKWNSKK